MKILTDRKWKANLLDYDWIAQQEGSKCYCLSDKTAQMLLTISQTLAWVTRWTGNEFFTDEQRENVFKWANEVEAQLLNGCCGDSGQTIRIRVNVDGRVEVSQDGGETWEPNDDYDPRSTGTVYQPINTGSVDEDACQAAANVVANMTELINEDFVGILTSLTAAAAISAALAPFVAAWIGVPVAGQGVATAALIAGLVGAGAAEGAAALTDAFDTEFYDWLNCEYYCTIGNGAADWGDVDGLIDAINTEYPDGGDDLTLRVVGFAVLKALGPVGLTNMARLGSSAADCTECDCGPWCWFADFTGSQSQGFVNYDGTGTGNGFLGSSGWTAGVDVPNSVKYVQARKEFTETIVSKVTYNYSLNPDDAGGNINNVQIRLFLDNVQVVATGHEVSTNETDATWVFEFDNVSCDMAQIGLECGAFEPYGTGSIHSATFEGPSGEPIEFPNCDDE